MKSRLGELPKTLAPIGGRPFLDYLLADLGAAGFREAVLCTGYAGEAVRTHCGTSKFGLSIAISQESGPRGTAGALRQARSLIKSNPFALLNGDSLLELDYSELLAKHSRLNATVTLALAAVPDGSRYGNVQIAPDSEILDMAEKPARSSLCPNRGKALIFGGVSILNQAVFDELPPDVIPLSLERDILPKFIGRGLFGSVCQGFFIDIGVPEDYDRACHELQRGCSVASSYSS